MKMIYTIGLVFFLLSAYGQSMADKYVSIDIDNIPLINVLYELSIENDIIFYFDPKDLPLYPLEAQYNNEPVYKILQSLLNGTNVMTVSVGDEGVALVLKEKISKLYIREIQEAWKTGRIKYPFVDELKVVNYTSGDSLDIIQNPILTIYLTDKATKEPIVGAVIKNEDYSITDVSDLEGIIRISVNNSKVKLSLSSIGYHSVEINAKLFNDGELKIPLEVQSVILSEVEIVGAGSRAKLEDTRIGAEVIDIQKIERIPQAMGEVDIIKSLEILPGVTSVGDISSGFNVRGGNVDESLVLFNDGMIFNPTHIVGFISAFNAESINSSTLYKGYVDGEYGNRSSAILDITADASKVKSFKGSGGIGTSLMKMFVEGTINKKIRYKLSGRASYNDYLLGLIANVKINRSNASFFDVNGSIAYDISDKHTIIFNTYNSDDFFEYNDEFGFEWQNGHLGLKLNSQWSDSFFSKVSLNRGYYSSNQFVINSPAGGEFSSGLSYIKLLSSASKQLGDKGYAKAGFEFIDYSTNRDILKPLGESTIIESSIKRPSARTVSPFLTINYKLLETLTVEASIRHANYFSTGPGNISIYENNIIQPTNIIANEPIEGNDPDGQYSVLEPRASLNYKYSSNISFRTGYNRMSQNIIQISNASSALPSDIFVLANRYIPPQIVDQFSLGVFNTNSTGSYNVSMEGFYKEYNNQRSLKQFPNIVLNDHIETELLQSVGSSYGIELFAEKNKGKIVGSFSYTYSRAYRRTIDDRGALNSGEQFPADFDIPHQVNVVMSYKWLPIASFQLAYVYKSGRPTTLPSETILQDGFLVPLYSSRNQSRIPYYSRLDMSITLDLRKVKTSGFRSSFNLGFYNLLSRKNAFNVFFRRGEGGNIQPFQFSIIGSVIPNFTWNFTF